MIVIIDYNVGNLKSVLGAFSRIGVDAVVSRDKEMIRKGEDYSFVELNLYLPKNNLQSFSSPATNFQSVLRQFAFRHRTSTV